MNQLILATHNDHKAQEFRDILPQYSVQTLADLGHDEEIEETATDLEGNSLLLKPKPFLSAMDMW